MSLLRAAAAETYGPLGGTAYETRELLLLLLPGDRTGELHVFDNNPDLGQDLSREDLTVLDLWNHEDWTQEENRSRQDYLARLAGGRRIEKRAHKSRGAGPINALRLPITQREMAKIRLSERDYFLEPLPDGEPFDLSVFLQSHYFSPALVSIPAWAGIISRTKVGGYLLSDMDLTFDGRVEGMGLRVVHETYDNPFHSGQSSLLYQRVEETPAVRELVSLHKSRMVSG